MQVAHFNHTTLTALVLNELKNVATKGYVKQ